MASLFPHRDPELHPFRQGLYFAFFNALNWQIATGTPIVLFMAYLDADAFQTGLVYAWPLLLTPVQVVATVLLPKLGFKRLTMAGWGARSWFLLVPLALALLSAYGVKPWMIVAMVVAMFCYSMSRSVGAAAITTWLQGLVSEKVRGRYWSTDQIMSGVASVGALVLCAVSFAVLPPQWAFFVQYAFSISGAWLALRCLKLLPDIERPTVMSLRTIWADTPRHLFGAGVFRPYLWLAVAFYVITTPVIPFSAYYLKSVGGFTSANIMGLTILQYGGVIAGNWFMRSRIDSSGAKPFFRISFGLFAVIAACWLGCLHWTVTTPWVMPMLYVMLGAGSGMFTAANVSYLAKIIPEKERALPVALHGAMTYFTGGLAPVVWGLMLKGKQAEPSLNLFAFECFFIVTLIGAVVLVVLTNRLEEKIAGHVDPLLEGGWLFRPFRVVASLIKLGGENGKR
ncbi:MFS transporter [Oleiharenicola lentus]|uniref:MFS transporter n=1 Tax=Oleiharenicola lentus TaxID=2508720 RepID=UPI003F662031